jgi:hypothetical protein
MASATQVPVPRVSQQSTPEEVAQAAADAVDHPLFKNLNAVERWALNNPHKNIRQTHAIIVRMGKMAREQPEAPSAVAPKATGSVASSILDDRVRADEILANELLCWAMTSCGSGQLLKLLALPKPKQVREALEEFYRLQKHFYEAVELRRALVAEAERIVDDQVGMHATMTALESLWPNAADLLRWIDMYLPEVKPALAVKLTRVREELENNWYDPELLPRAIFKGDAFLGQHVGRRRRK